MSTLPDDCIDISRWSPVYYNTTHKDMFDYDVIRIKLFVKNQAFCEEVTQEQCDKEWKEDAFGNVFLLDVNCKNVTWEECSIMPVVKTEKVKKPNCRVAVNIYYQTPLYKTMEVTSYKTSCKSIGGAWCKVNHVQECTEVTWSDCLEKVIPTCKPIYLRTPNQERIHRKRCPIKY